MSAFAQLPQALAHLDVHRSAWETKPLLREIYAEFYGWIKQWCSHVPGKHVELGCGQADFRRFLPGVACCDIVPFPWVDFAADACRLPLADASAANLSMIDVLHHLPYVRRFFSEASRVLAPGGRLIMVEPFVSPASWPIYRFLHREPINGRVRPLSAAEDEPLSRDDQALDSNQAIPTSVFWRERKRFNKLYPNLRVIHRQPVSTLLYPLSGGFEGPRLVPVWAVPLVRGLERALSPLARWMAFRCLVVVERASKARARNQM
jgi:SAM-dependent methyltransferase